jgi:NAD(P)-dependent dehydrogenase (short-subunit alcohol dehydrogenase family)
MDKQINGPYSLEGKKVIVLGGSSGIGLATATAAAQEGAEVRIVSGNQQRIDAALTGLPATAKGYIVDLNKEEEIKSLFQKTGAFDHLVYTAGENLNLTVIAATDVEKAREFFNIRYWGAFMAIKYGAPRIQPGGSISLISGTANARPGKGWSLASSIWKALSGRWRLNSRR